MVCGEFQDLLLEYTQLPGETLRRVDLHIEDCAGCREFLEALRAVDADLAAQFTGREVSPQFAPAVRRRLSHETAMPRPSFIPELLDLVGWGAILALIALLAWWGSAYFPIVSTNDTLTMNLALGAGGAFMLAAFVIGLNSLAALKSRR